MLTLECIYTRNLVIFLPNKVLDGTTAPRMKQFRAIRKTRDSDKKIAFITDETDESTPWRQDTRKQKRRATYVTRPAQTFFHPVLFDTKGV